MDNNKGHDKNVNEITIDSTNMLYIRKGDRYDYKLKCKDDRAKYIDERLDFISKLPPDVVMGYLDNSRNIEKKYDKIPKMIDAYATYFLTSTGVSNRADSEYPYYVNERDDKRKTGNKMVNDVRYSNDNNTKLVEFDNGVWDTPANKASKSITEESFGDEYSKGSSDINCDILKYTLNSNELSVRDYRRVLSMSQEIVMRNEDEELTEMIEKIISKCSSSTDKEEDLNILRLYIAGETARFIGEVVGLSHTTVQNRIDNMLCWV